MVDWVQIALGFLGGFGLFLFGMEYMGEGLQKVAGNKMKNLLGVLTSNRFLGVLVGAGITALIQSSSATTVMVVGFVNAGLMSLRQAVGVIMGANIGTTITAWIVALGEWTKYLKPAVIAPVFIVVGVVMISFGKSKNIKNIGQIAFGFGTLFLGLESMSNAADPLRELPQIKDAFVTLGQNLIFGVLVGVIVTAIIQSSSASVGILQALATAGLVPWNSAIYIIMGQNIGTCITAILSSIGASTNAKRAGVIHFLFNFIGSVAFTIIAFLVFTFALPRLGTRNIGLTEISIVHTVFNILNTIVLFPFGNVLVNLAELIVRDGNESNPSLLQHLDDRILETPSFALENAAKEVMRMGRLAQTNVQTAIDGLFDRDSKKINLVFEQEKTINALQQGINDYLIKLTHTNLSESENYMVTSLFHTVGDIERVGDHAENIAELADEMIKQSLKFSNVAQKEIKEISGKANQCFELALKGYAEQNEQVAREAIPCENYVDKLEERYRTKHMKRLAEELCDPRAGIVFLDMLSNVERISDHALNIAQSVLNKNKYMINDDGR
ncbi:Na/Pi cotransporter family protein [Cellulosilyticum ruminicola]|uniref:Na/Pi cotransporter family protein n=1 Tax=Cellulosilyticum ruminicola TaxID=425254 RepID=UPI0006D0089A|nr:Na/Pi cotransporter family protein [Cellulosilyticum ruminicola]